MLRLAENPSVQQVYDRFSMRWLPELFWLTARRRDAKRDSEITGFSVKPSRKFKITGVRECPAFHRMSAGVPRYAAVLPS